MPEENFEQQARRKAEEFRMEPKPEVWLRVKGAIAPVKRRRRVLLWWLLPLCLAGATAMWLADNRTILFETKTSTVAVIDSNRSESKEPILSVKSRKNEEKKLKLFVERKSAKQKKQDWTKRIFKKHTHTGLENNYNEGTNRNSLSRSFKKKTEEQAAQTLKANQQRSDAIKGNEEVKISIKEPDTGLQNIRKPQSTMAMNNSINNDNEAKTDIIATITNNNSSTKTDNNVIIKKKEQAQKKRSWQTGIAAEIGLTSWGKDLLYNEVAATEPLNFYDVSSGSAVTRDSIINNTSAFQQTKNGLTAAVGLAVRKDIQNHFYINGQLGYSYQQYEVYNLRGSAIPQPSASAAYFVNKDNYRTHFFDVTVSVGKSLFYSKRNGLSAEAGIDNSFLLTMKQQNANGLGNFNINGSLDAGNFYCWQPHLMVCLPFDWHSTDKVRFLLSPFARVGLRSFQKNSSDYKNNHLVSAGIQAVYFFK